MEKSFLVLEREGSGAVALQHIEAELSAGLC